jgi:hypothetical protein
MHHRHLQTAVIMGDDVAGIGETGFLRHWQGIEFGAQHYHRARAVFEHAHYARAPDSWSDVVSKFAKLVGNFGGSLFLVIRKLGITVQVEIQGFDLGINGIDLAGWNLPGLGAPRGN